jgi:hypothetical protein
MTTREKVKSYIALYRKATFYHNTRCHCFPLLFNIYHESLQSNYIFENIKNKPEISWTTAMIS